MSRKKQNILWLLLFTMWPFLLWGSYQFYFIHIEGQSMDLFLFACLICIVSLFPIVTDRYTIFFINGINIVAFLIFGLFVEIIFAQMAVIIVIMRILIVKRQLFRLPLNMLSFMFISIISAEVFYLLGGKHGLMTYQSIEDIYPIVCYALSVFVSNKLFNKLIDVYFYKRRLILFDRGFKWEFIALLLTLPVGFLLYLLYASLGKVGIIFAGIPFIFITVILRILYSYQEVNHYLKKTGEIGHELTKSMEVDSILYIFIKNIVKSLPLDHVYIYTILDAEHLKLIRFYDVKGKNQATFTKIKRNEGFSGAVWSLRQPIIYHDSSKWKAYKSSKIPQLTESVLSLPIEYGNSMIGVVTVLSNQKGAFEKIHYRFLKNITNYLGVAIENAEKFEKIQGKGEKDGLTQLYNFEYVDKELRRYSEKVEHTQCQDPLSLILLDLDHFKVVNDTYGHEAGNEVLYQVATRLKEETNGLGTLARYGGEEFILLLPQMSLTQAMVVAENIRSCIAIKPFQVQKHLLPTDGIASISLTTSIGVSSYPIHCETPYELIHHADRAMYVGAKNKGRNKVATYEIA